MRNSRRLSLAGAVLACLAVALLAGSAEAAVVRLPASERAVIQNPEALSERRVLMQFDLPEHLSDGVVEIAMLEFRTAVAVADSSRGVALDCFAVTTAWSEEAASWSSQ